MDASTILPQAPALLLCETLGFSPQLLLDDIINIANNAVQDGVNGMEEFLDKWASERINGSTTTKGDTDAITHEVEQGLVAFQTLLEYHTDIAFDFFEAWCMRNIFIIPPDLPIILPHHQGRDLTLSSETEQELQDEIESLRRRLDGQRKLRRLLKRAIHTSSRQLSQAQTRLSSLATLQGPTIDKLERIPERFQAMYTTLASLPPLGEPQVLHLPETGKRPWETSKTGYMNWAVERLLATKGLAESPDGSGNSAIDKLDLGASSIGTANDLRQAMEAVGRIRDDLEQTFGNSRRQNQDEGTRMEE